MSDSIKYVIQMFKSLYSDTRGFADDAEKELDELERLADVGRATEMAFENSKFFMKESYKLRTGIIFDDVEDLLEWAKEQTK